MKKVITMVGTSLFENYIDDKDDDKDFARYIIDLRDISAKEYDDERGRINYIEEKINVWFRGSNDRSSCSAEIKSLLKLKSELKDELEIHLVCSDTLLGKLAGEILKKEVASLGEEVFCYLIEGLQIKSREGFTNGMNNLINRIYSIARGYWNNVVMNITGGYKVTLPYLIILAQVNKCPIYYIFRDVDTLIKVPYIPLDINWRIFEENENFFMSLERQEIVELPPGIHYKEEIGSLIERVDNLVSLNPLGVALWEKYKERFSVFYISDIVKLYLDRCDKDYKEICEKSILELERRLKENPNNSDLNHSLKEIDLRNFRCFKHKEKNLQVRVLYKSEQWQTRYKSKEINLYIGSIAIGSEVHNAGTNAEYVEKFYRELKSSSVANFKDYRVLKIKKEVYCVS